MSCPESLYKDEQGKNFKVNSLQNIRGNFIYFRTHNHDFAAGSTTPGSK